MGQNKVLVQRFKIKKEHALKDGALDVGGTADLLPQQELKIKKRANPPPEKDDR